MEIHRIDNAIYRERFRSELDCCRSVILNLCCIGLNHFSICSLICKMYCTYLCISFFRQRFRVCDLNRHTCFRCEFIIADHNLDVKEAGSKTRKSFLFRKSHGLFSLLEIGLIFFGVLCYLRSSKISPLRDFRRFIICKNNRIIISGSFQSFHCRHIFSVGLH